MKPVYEKSADVGGLIEELLVQQFNEHANELAEELVLHTALRVHDLEVTNLQDPGPQFMAGEAFDPDYLYVSVMEALDGTTLGKQFSLRATYLEPRQWEQPQRDAIADHFEALAAELRKPEES